jgi:2-amino-4-hydroxy-6-hydroxymethyldihydropteridine diphosphokinase
MHVNAVLGLGSNNGNRFDVIRNCCRKISEHCNTIEFLVSGLYMSEPVGEVEGGEFLNGVMLLDWTAGPYKLQNLTRTCEVEAGSEVKKHGKARKLDVDLLFMEGVHLNTSDLILPHPRLSERYFVLFPLSEIAPDLIIYPPNTCATDLLRICPDRSDLVLFKKAPEVCRLWSDIS